MCWNANVSLNTFLFSSFVLSLIIYNNAYTQYKIPYLSFYAYIFMASFIIMQLVEFFLWKNINNKEWNEFITYIVFLILAIQPITSLLMITTNDSLRNNLILLYSAIAIPILTYIFSIKTPYTYVSQKSHLNWKIDIGLNNFITIFIIWLCFFFFSFIYNKWYLLFIFGILLFTIMIFRYLKDKTYSSMWCWAVNSIFIYFAFILLIYSPFLENNELC